MNVIIERELEHARAQHEARKESHRKHLQTERLDKAKSYKNRLWTAGKNARHRNFWYHPEDREKALLDPVEELQFEEPTAEDLAICREAIADAIEFLIGTESNESLILEIREWEFKLSLYELL